MNVKDLRRRLPSGDDLNEILAWREERTVAHNLTLHYDRTMLILEPTALARRKVKLVNYPDEGCAVRTPGRPPPRYPSASP